MKAKPLYLILFWIIVIIIVAIAKNFIVFQKRSDLPFVKIFGINLEIPDLPNKYYEGGLQLYLESQPLQINHMIARDFDKGQTIKARLFSASALKMGLSDFTRVLEKSIIQSNSHNIFNASKIVVFGSLSDGKFFIGQKNLNPNLDRSLDRGYPIVLDQMNFVIKSDLPVGVF